MRRFFLWVAIVLSVIAYFCLGLHYGVKFLFYIKTSPNDAKTMVDILRSLVETMALIIAGFWTYERFIKSREEHPYPKIQHQVECHKSDFSVGSLYFLSLFVTITNEGKNKIDDIMGNISIDQVSPLPTSVKNLVREKTNKAEDDAIRLGKIPDLFIDEQRLKLVALGIREWRQKGLEPGQTKVIRFDFLIEDVDIISVSNRFKYEKSGAYTDFTTLHSLKKQNTSDQ